MDSDTRQRVAFTAGWAALGGAAAVLTGSTPLGVAMVAALGGGLAWHTGRGARSPR